MDDAFTGNNMKQLLVILNQKTAVLGLHNKFATQYALSTFCRLLSDLDCAGSFYLQLRR
jgi:hypothetical protein